MNGVLWNLMPLFNDEFGVDGEFVEFDVNRCWSSQTFCTPIKEKY